MLRFRIPLVSADSDVGYKYIERGDYFQHVKTGQVIKKFRMIEYYEGFQYPSGTIDTVKRFTGQIREWNFDRTSPEAEIICYDWMMFAKDAVNLGYPNPSDYWSVDYWESELSGVDGDNKPVCYDGWELDKAVESNIYTSFIDPWLCVQKKEFLNLSGTIVKGGYLVEQHSFPDELKIRLDKPRKYGTSDDEEYGWRFSVGDSLQDNIDKIVDNFGYDWGFTPKGYLYLRTLNNPSDVYFWDDLTYSGTWSVGTNLSALSGAYKYTTEQGAYASKMVKGSRFVAIIGCQNLNAGTFQFKLTNTVLGSVACFDRSTYHTSDWFYYDGIDTSVGYNPTKIEVASGLIYDEYELKITAVSSGAKMHILNAIFCYDVDRTSHQIVIKTDDSNSTAGEISGIRGETSSFEIRNDSIVIGKLLGAYSSLTGDAELNPLNPANPIYQHIFARSVDIDSLCNTTATNFVGRPLQSIIIEPTVITQTRADWLSYELLRRYKDIDKCKTLSIEILGNPIVEIGDCVGVVESLADTVSTIQNNWITAINNTKELTSYKTVLELSPFEPFPSYEKRGNPSLSLFGGEAIVNVRIYNKGAMSTLSSAIANTTTSITMTAIPTLYDIPSIGWARFEEPTSLKFEIISYTGRTTTSLTGCTRGKQSTTATNHAKGVLVNIAMDPYLSEERGTVPEIYFDLVNSGYVRLTINSLVGDRVDILTKLNESNYDLRWDKVEWGRNIRYNWGMMDNKGDWNKTCGTWCPYSGLNLEETIGAGCYVQERKFNSGGNWYYRSCATFSLSIELEDEAQNKYFWPTIGSSATYNRIMTRRGKPVSIDWDLSGVSIWDAAYLYYYRQYTGEENSLSGPTIQIGQTNEELRKCRVLAQSSYFKFTTENYDTYIYAPYGAGGGEQWITNRWRLIRTDFATPYEHEKIEENSYDARATLELNWSKPEEAFYNRFDYPWDWRIRYYTDNQVPLYYDRINYVYRAFFDLVEIKFTDNSGRSSKKYGLFNYLPVLFADRPRDWADDNSGNPYYFIWPNQFNYIIYIQPKLAEVGGLLSIYQDIY